MDTYVMDTPDSLIEDTNVRAVSLVFRDKNYSAKKSREHVVLTKEDYIAVLEDVRAWKWIIFTGYFGTFFPNYFFAFAETVIDSSVAAVLNGMTPLFTLLIGLVFFGSLFKWSKILGVTIGFGGTLILVSNEFTINNRSESWYAFLVICATFCYAINVNVIKYKLEKVSSIGIALGNFLAIVFPSILIFSFSNFPMGSFIKDPNVITSLGYIFVLAVFGTALDSFLQPERL